MYRLTLIIGTLILQYKMTGESLNIVEDQLEKLKQLFPESITDGKIDWEKLQATLGKENIVFSNERYVLNWAGKSEAFKVLQQSTTATLKPTPEESINFGSTENVFIEGENLEVLKILQKSYYSKIKCIIIDPPYNTGSDSFIYPDSFKESKEEYQKRIGEIDEEGYLMKEGFFRKNSKDSGHYHSNWLSMMYPRLFLAKNLLKDDGVISIFIDDNESHNLRLLMNEVFGEENFLADLIWEKRYTRSNDAKFFASVIDHILIFKKSASLTSIKQPRTESSNDIYTNPDNDYRGSWTSVSYVSQRTKAQRPNLSYEIENPFTGKSVEHPTNAWKFSSAQNKKHIQDKQLWWGKDGSYQFPRLKKFLSELTESMVPTNLWKYQDAGTVDDGTKEVDAIIGKDIFDYPKPTSVITKILRMATTKDGNDIILDFFAGSGTTAQSVLELNKKDIGNRKFILVQLPEKCDEESEAYKNGYNTIADISKERIRRVISKLTNENEQLKIKKEGELKFEDDSVQENKGLDNGFKVFKLSSSNFKIWRGNEITEENLEQQLEMFTNPVREGSEKENMLYELMLKAGYLLTDEVEYVYLAQEAIGYYSVNDGDLIIALEKMNQTLIDDIISAKPKKVITLDQLFTENDQLKTNAVLQMRDAEIDFKTI
jgi:adenine-specific DNA-methyltransferase